MMDLTAQPVTPQELDEWLRSTDVDDPAAEEDANKAKAQEEEQSGELQQGEGMAAAMPLTPLTSSVSAPMTSRRADSAGMRMHAKDNNKQRLLSRRRSSLDYAHAGGFGIDERTMLLANRARRGGSNDGSGGSGSGSRDDIGGRPQEEVSPLAAGASAGSGGGHRDQQQPKIPPSAINAGVIVAENNHVQPLEEISPLVSDVDDGSMPSHSPYDNLASRKVNRREVLSKMNGPPFPPPPAAAAPGLAAAAAAAMSRRNSNEATMSRRSSNASCRSGKTCSSSDTVPHNNNSRYSRSVSAEEAFQETMEGGVLFHQHRHEASSCATPTLARRSNCLDHGEEVAWPLQAKVSHDSSSKIMSPYQEEGQHAPAHLSRSVSLPVNDANSPRSLSRQSCSFPGPPNSNNGRAGLKHTADGDFVMAMEQSRHSQAHSVHSRRSIGLMKETSRTRELLFRIMRRNEESAIANQQRTQSTPSRSPGIVANPSSCQGFGHRRASGPAASSSTASSSSSTPFPSYSHHFRSKDNHRRNTTNPAIGGWRQQDRMNLMLQNIINAEEEMKMKQQHMYQKQQTMYWQQQQQQQLGGGSWNKQIELGGLQEAEREEQIIRSQGGMWRPAPKHGRKHHEQQLLFQQQQKELQQQHPMKLYKTMLNQGDAVQAELQRIAREQMRLEMESIY